MKKLDVILDQVDLGAIALPEFQRGYVWSRDQVRSLMDSLYQEHPVGGLLVWITESESAEARGHQPLQPGVVHLLLDGQQRITSLYGIIRGMPPEFFDGDEKVFTGLYFNLENETFEFYSPRKMENNPLWINVTDLMRNGVAAGIKALMHDEEIPQEKLETYMDRLNAITSITKREFHIDEVTGPDKTIDVVVDIFNRVNSGGTKLSKGDLALAHICAKWPDARNELKVRLAKWSDAGFDFKIDWFLRCINTVVTGEARFEVLSDVKVPDFKWGLKATEDAIDKTLDLLAWRLGVDNESVLGGRYAFPIITHYLVRRNHDFGNHQERDKLLYWYVHSFLWGRYTGSTESVLNQDLEVVEDLDGALDRLIDQLNLVRGYLALRPDDFDGWSRGARFYPLLYMMTRVWHAQDWGSGIELQNFFLHRLGSLQLHHIFPKAQLYADEFDYERREVNALANFTFLTQETNLAISDRKPIEYFPEVQEAHPGALESHWMPTDPYLWRLENYRGFLARRRELLAEAANAFLDGLYRGTMPEIEQSVSVFEREGVAPGGIATDEEEAKLLECKEWVRERGLAEGEITYELVDEETGEFLAVIDLAWPQGVQEGLSRPVAILLDEPDEVEEIVNQFGYLYFTNLERFYNYIEQEILSPADEYT